MQVTVSARYFVDSSGFERCCDTAKVTQLKACLTIMELPIMANLTSGIDGVGSATANSVMKATNAAPVEGQNQFGNTTRPMARGRSVDGTPV